MERNGILPFAQKTEYNFVVNTDHEYLDNAKSSIRLSAHNIYTIFPNSVFWSPSTIFVLLKTIEIPYIYKPTGKNIFLFISNYKFFE